MIHLACGFDDHYAPHATAMLASALAHLPATKQVTVHILHDDNLSQQSIVKLKNSLTENAAVRLLQVTDLMMAGLPVETFHHACWHRIFLPELMTGVDRVLYLDADMIVVDDLLPLWETILDGFLFGAVANPLYPFMPPHPITRLGLSGLTEYLNTGCLLMELSKLRDCDFSNKVKAYAAKHPNNLWPEQDAISALFPNQWKKLHPRWNVQTTFFDLPPDQLPVPKNQAIEAVQNPAIIHFIGPNKPWDYLCVHPWRDEYRRWMEKTAWGTQPLEGRTMLNIFLRPLPLVWQRRMMRLIAKLR